MKSVKHTVRCFCPVLADCGLYIETIQHEILVLRTKASIGLMTIFHINNLNTENKIAFPSFKQVRQLEKLGEWKEVNYNSRIFRKKKNKTVRKHDLSVKYPKTHGSCQS